MLVCFARHIFDKSIVLFRSIILFATHTFRIKKEYLAVFHADNVIWIEKIFASLTLFVHNRIVLLSSVAVLVPPINKFCVFFKETIKLLLG